MPENMSGLFDKGSAGEARLSSASIEDDLDLSGFDPVDFLSSLEKDNPLNLGDVFTMGEEDLGNTAPLDGGLSEGLTDMEVFTDLSTMLGGVPGELDDSQMVTLDASMLDEIIMVNPISIEPVPASEGTRATKRKSSDALSDCSSASNNPDHDDYTVKRPRVATADSTVETPEDARPSTSASPTPSCSSVAADPQPGGTKYVERRIKNNIASRRSRQTRKQKFQDMEVQAEELVVANEKLQQQVAELEKLTKVMKDILVQKLAKGSSS